MDFEQKIYHETTHLIYFGDSAMKGYRIQINLNQ